MSPNLVFVLTGALAALIFSCAAYAGLSLYVAHRMTTPRRVAALADPAWHNGPALQRQCIASAHGGLPLAASWLPTEGARSAVLFVHGKDCCRGGEVRVSTAPLVHALHASGVAVLMIDLRGHGDSAASRMTYGIHEAGDVLGGLNWLRQRGFEPGHIGVFAASMGGAGALRALMRHGAAGPIVLDSAYADFGAMMDKQFSFLTGLPRVFLPGALAASRWLIRADLRQIRPVEDAAQLAGRPVLVIHADEDPFVPVADARRLADAAQGELWVTSGRHHLASFRNGPHGYVERVSAFFGQHLGAGQPASKTESLRAAA
jgi:fermentation-respiration switch protein FrsA (DUF1100 family)